MHAVDPDDDFNALTALERRLEALATEAVGAQPKSAPDFVCDTAELAAARERLLAAVSDSGRFERYVAPVAALADVSEHTARGWLDAVWGAAPRWEMAAPGVRAWWVEGGPKAHNALRGFVHVGASNALPQHKHLGAEHMLVLQGGARVSTGERLRAGDSITSAAGVVHAFEATQGPDLLVFTVAFDGLDFGRFVARPRD